MQRADRIVAIGLIFVSLGVAWKSTELPVGILPKEGPGGGFLPFWLSLGIAAVALMVLIQSLVSSRRDKSNTGGAGVFMSREGLGDLLRVGLPGMIMILLIGVISVYFSAALFIFYCLFMVGGHNLKTSVGVSIGVPVVMYYIFEKFLIIPLPKGYAEFLFYWN
ncbi:MAG: tripartite tricarboxylate transporter TctB family protein [Nitrospinae bacterium]|nr:tripartite tricarboxylate transporter TctB family protein [Nitrospinota bacterium]